MQLSLHILLTMAPRSNATVSTLRTVDDVMSQMESDLPGNASLSQARKYIRKKVGENKNLIKDTIDELENLETYLSAVTPNPRSLIKSMMDNNIFLGGSQATSLFYPISEVYSSPWNFFGYSFNIDRFITEYVGSSMADVVESTSLPNGNKVVHLRRNLPSSENVCTIRVFGSNLHPIYCILNLKFSYEHTVISATSAVCFWRRLMQMKCFREFEANSGLMDFPKGNTFYEIKITPGKPTSLRTQMESTSIYTVSDKKLECIIFKNTCNLDNRKYIENLRMMQNIVYAVSNDSCRYLGNIAGMK